ncbi:NAD-dependent succinate-semialdehyde dehydrogenase [Marinobacterium stanieri]|uniref:NAD-dependent succinate-semialdehyde dehydrogenase n=1 Tax=Marinobacterium stanieri TaxID=49186 RepID=UPI0002558B71|nr:NAD-dependent succinate-semialdehyde dehydrogenase [Marinobacterium stanieri]
MENKQSSLIKHQAYIDGVWSDAIDGTKSCILNPATGEVVGAVPNMGQEETRRAIEAAAAAQKIWRAKTAAERSGVLRRWYELILQNSQELAGIITAEQGKPMSEAEGEVKYAASFIEWYAEEAKRIYGDTIPGHQVDKRITVRKEPIGVAAAITPWNFPAAMVTRKAAPALAVGCSMILKPAPQTPHTALALVALAERAGVPAGVLSVVTADVHGSIEVGAELCRNPLVRKLSFTGSTGVGIKLMEQCAPTLKKLSLELGGNAPFIVFDDADLDSAVEGALASKFRNNGQTCVCANRLYVQDSVYDIFVERLARAVAELKVGIGTDDGVDMGPLIDQQAIAKVQSHLQDATAKGARVVTGGQAHALGGTFFEPTVLRDVPADALVSREETFGPVAPVFRFKDESEVIAYANDTEFGLAAYFYAQDVSRIHRVGEALEYGIVGINTGIISTEVAPFGGMKSSGFGREGSKYGVEDYLEIKYLCLQINL